MSESDYCEAVWTEAAAISEIAKGEADHTPSPLPQGIHRFINSDYCEAVWSEATAISEIAKGEADHAPSPLQQGRIN